MPAVPGAGLVVVQAEFVFGGLEAVLDQPTMPFDGDQGGNLYSRRAPGREEREVTAGDVAPGQQASGPGQPLCLRPLKVGEFKIAPVMQPRPLGSGSGRQALPRIGRDGSGDHDRGELGFGRKACCGRDVGCGHAGRVVGPTLGQIQCPIDKGVAVTRDVGREHPDLAVGDLAGRSGILPPHPARGPALLEEPSLVDHQHRILVSQRFERVVPHDVA